ncbi:gamma carbonic anhydrase family protein [Pedobacter sp. L105]|uniref:gamma carbonic anhydrase family protein n=1 Tax=Pedobacter sp. L105 TaxID=1641871 RepID=UPI00131B3EE6|nr:gamma carbonic anhydrase family protein [Pedobacter sp. L105]
MIHPTAKIHPSVIIDGDVEIGAGTYIAPGAIISAVGGKISIGANAVILENAIIRSSKHFNCVIGDHTLIGPKASVTGATIENACFIATGATIFHGSYLETGTVLAVNGIIHIATHCPVNTFIPINHIGFGNPLKIYPPSEIQDFHADLKKVGFAKYVYGIDTTGLSNTEVYTQLTDKFLSFLG